MVQLGQGQHSWIQEPSDICKSHFLWIVYQIILRSLTLAKSCLLCNANLDDFYVSLFEEIDALNMVFVSFDRPFCNKWNSPSAIPSLLKWVRFCFKSCIKCYCVKCYLVLWIIYRFNKHCHIASSNKICVLF